MREVRHIAISILAVLVLLLTACGVTSTDYIYDELKLNVSSGTVVSQSDTHGGFHNDGLRFISLEFEDETVLDEIKDSGDWEEFPLSETAEALVYGIEYESEGMSVGYGPYLTDDEGNAMVPEIQNGYYRLIDWWIEEGRTTDTDILNRGAFNLSLGLYDTDTDTLYYFRLDT